MSTASNRGRDLVRVRNGTRSQWAGQHAEVVRKKPRRRGPRTINPRFDYLLRFRDGSELWFWDEEIEA